MRIGTGQNNQCRSDILSLSLAYGLSKRQDVASTLAYLRIGNPKNAWYPNCHMQLVFLLLGWLACSMFPCNLFAKEQEVKFPDLSFQVNPNKDSKTPAKKELANQDGWPEGLDGAYKVRFIRLDHGWQGWDDGMRRTQADINLLRDFASESGLKQIATKGESHRIGLLDKYPRDGFPPFVFFTGNHGVGKVSLQDVKILREYCLGGGLLIADAGSKQFHDSFIHLMRQVFPDKRMLDIADDDKLYQLPFSFPDGAPAFWHHGGKRPQGIKHDGRWVVFYHPGDMNDAWKSDEYTDVTAEMRTKALNLGVNLIYYAFESWDRAVAKVRN